MINILVGFLDGFSFDLIDGIQLVITILVGIVLIAVLLMTSESFTWRLGVLGLIMIFTAVSARTICQIFSLDVNMAIGSLEVSVQYAIITLLYILGLILTIAAFIISKMRKK